MNDAPVLFFSLHDLIFVKLVNCPETFREFISSGLGFLKLSKKTVKPDITITFTDELSLTKPVYYISTNAGYNSDVFFIIDRAGFKATIPFEDIGTGCEIKCEKGFDQSLLYNVFLESIILPCCFLMKKSVFIHASSFIYKGKGIVLTSWSLVGKTTILLYFLAEGFGYLTDDWAIVTSQLEILPYPRSLSLKDYHFKLFPKLRSSLSKEQIFTLWIKEVFNRTRVLCDKSNLLHKLSRGIEELFNQYHIVKVPVSNVVTADTISKAVPLSKLFFLLRGTISKISIEEANPVVVARKMVTSMKYENKIHFEYYEMFKFAFPLKRHQMTEYFEQNALDILIPILRNTQLYLVHIPKSMNLYQVYQAIRTCL